MGGRGSAGRAAPGGQGSNRQATGPDTTPNEPTPPEQVPPAVPERSDTTRPETETAGRAAETTRLAQGMYDAIEAAGGVRDRHNDINWVHLADLRRHLGGTRAEQDTHLRRLYDEGFIELANQADRRNQTADARAAGIRIGGDDNHLVFWNIHTHPDRPEVQ